ncbi:hypothetical protein HY948_03700 [Candidatus Gottesmanbacteria bacterium]|nr:hypothetical protein [Candidatus Gottesmanbacteria bacterium]
MPIWEWIPILTNLQYPWRLLSVVIVATPFLTATIFSRLRWRMVFIGAMILTVILSFSYTKPVLYAPRPDEYYLSKREFTDGTSSLGNSFSTVWSPWKSSRAVRLVDVVQGKGTVTVQSKKPLSVLLAADMKEDAMVRVNILYFPGWVVMIDGKKQAIDYKKDGTISFLVGKGSHIIRVLFTETPVRVGADLLSLASLLYLSGLSILKRYYAHSA